MNQISKIWMLSREYRGVAGAGGVQDVVRDLAESLAESGYEVTVIMPCYGFIEPEKQGFVHTGISLDVDLNYTGEERREVCSYFELIQNNVRLILVSSSRFDEKFGIYTNTSQDIARDPTAKLGSGYYDYFAMNVLHQKAALSWGMFLNDAPQIIHCHDGHTALIPVMMRELEGFRTFYRFSQTVLTIHNAGIGYHQEIADLEFARAVTGLPRNIIYSLLLNGLFDPLVAGAVYSRVNTVSENYARELRETELDAITGWLGHTLKDRMISLSGITNGINAEEYDPADSERLGIPAGFNPGVGDFAGKDACRQALLDMLSGRGDSELASEFINAGVQINGRIAPSFPYPLFTVVSRLNEQKGMDIFANTMEEKLISKPEFHMVLLGNGENVLENRFIKLANSDEYQGRFVYLSGFNSRLANFVYAAGDFLLIPSRFEPCGLTDLIAQLMANIPLVRSTGGLVKIEEGVNGLCFKDLTETEIESVFFKAITLYRDSYEEFLSMRKKGVEIVKNEYTWKRVVSSYIELYEEAWSDGCEGICESDIVQ